VVNHSIIIPVYNRLKELECCLVCLLQQTYNEFEVIIADDGSSVDTLGLVKKFIPDLNIKYFWQPDRGFRAGQARNRGVALMDKRSDTIIFLDSDIIIKKDWLKTYDKLHRKYPECIVCGRYDFLLPMHVRVEDVMNRFDEVVSNRLPIRFIPRGELLGADIRQSLFKRDKKLRNKKKERPKSGSGGALFGGNVLIPKKAFLEVNGFDEKIIGHGGEDSECGMRLDEVGYKFIFTDEPMGWHIWHKRNQQKNIKSLKRNISYIDKKHKKCGK